MCSSLSKMEQGVIVKQEIEIKEEEIESTLADDIQELKDLKIKQENSFEDFPLKIEFDTLEKDLDIKLENDFEGFPLKIDFETLEKDLDIKLKNDLEGFPLKIDFETLEKKCDGGMSKDNLCQVITPQRLQLKEDPKCSIEQRNPLSTTLSYGYKCLNGKFNSKCHLTSTNNLLSCSKVKSSKYSECSYECITECSLEMHLLTQSRIEFQTLEKSVAMNSSLPKLRNIKSELEGDIKARIQASRYPLVLLPKLNAKVYEKYSKKQKYDERIKPFKCPECSYECITKSYLNKHLITHDAIKPFKCSERSYECSQNGTLKKHLLTHSRIKPFKFHECREGDIKGRIQASRYPIVLLPKLNAKVYEKYSKKQKYDDRIKPFKCSKCSYECSRKGTLRQHLLTHSRIKPFKCSKCSYECIRKSSLKIHILTHGAIKPLKCSECSYECIQKGNLRSHILTHGGIKPFKCSECSYECIQRGTLKNHLLTHGAMKPLKCSECNYECIQKCTLKHHLLTHSEIKPFKCSECSYECIAKGNFKRHLLIHSKKQTI